MEGYLQPGHILTKMALLSLNIMKTVSTRQSEMANTSPRHMPVLGNVHPIVGIYIFRDVISLLARVFIFVIHRATQEVPMKIFERNCQSSF